MIAMILEALVTTLNDDGSVNVAPMGPTVGPDIGSFVLRPFRSSTTYRNLQRVGEGVLHVTDDVLMMARAAIGIDPRAETRNAEIVQGRVILSACRYHEFRVIDRDDSGDRVTMTCEVVASGTLRDFFGFNRAKHAVIEAAILATRVGLLPMTEMTDALGRLQAPVEKTGGPDERLAFALLVDHVRRSAGSAEEPPRSALP
jgi:hypothetical protein